MRVYDPLFGLAPQNAHGFSVFQKTVLGKFFIRIETVPSLRKWPYRQLFCKKFTSI